MLPTQKLLNICEKFEDFGTYIIIQASDKPNEVVFTSGGPDDEYSECRVKITIRSSKGISIERGQVAEGNRCYSLSQFKTCLKLTGFVSPEFTLTVTNFLPLLLVQKVTKDKQEVGSVTHMLPLIKIT